MKKKTATALALSLGILASGSASFTTLPTAMAAQQIDFKDDTAKAKEWSKKFNEGWQKNYRQTKLNM